jgi:deoxyribodipyrimidine photo-lyase
VKQVIAVHWFRRDLRLDDNEALKAAVDSGLPVLPIYCQPKEALDSTWLGIGRWGSGKLQFLQESLFDLDTSLRAIGGEVFSFEMPIVEAMDLISKYFDVELVTFHSEWAWEEAQEECELEANLSGSGTSIRKFFGQSLYHPDDVAKVHSEIPDVFGQFRKKLEKQCQVRECLNPAEEIKLPNSIPDAFQAVDSLTRTKHETARFSGGESMGRERLDYYIWQTGKLGFYK